MHTSRRARRTKPPSLCTVVGEPPGHHAPARNRRLGGFRGDERKVKQVLLILLSYALKFAPEGSRVEVRAGLADGMVESMETP